MTITTPLWRRVAVVAATAVAAGSLLGVSAAQAAAPTPTHGTTVDYFADVYDDLGANSVFETVTVERFEYILKNKSGNFAFLIGDPEDASTQATIGHINAVAKAQGIEHIYNFTPKLDGDTLNLWDLSESGLRDAGLSLYEGHGNRLLTDYLNKDTSPQFTKNESTDPYLFVYNKDRTVGDDEDRIVASLAGAKTAADLDTQGEIDAYRAEVAAVLDDVPAAQYATNTQFEFHKDENNRRHTTTAAYSNPETHGGDILEDSDNTDAWRIQTLTYPELIHLLEQPGDIPLLFGGTWCHNTRAIIKDVNKFAQEYGVNTVYNFDFSLFSTGNGGTDYGHIRDHHSGATSGVPNAVDASGKVLRPSHLYGDLVNDYLTNAVTQYKKPGDPGAGTDNYVQYFPGGDTTKAPQAARKIQVGHVLSYNKDRVNALGEREPVVDQAIRQNDDGGNTEHMTEWWYVAGRDYAATDGRLRGPLAVGSNQLQSQRAFAKEAIDEIETVFKGISGQNVATTTTVSGVTGTVSEGATPTLDVTVAAEGYAPFISLNTANENAAPNNTTGKPRGWVALFDGNTKLAEARLKRDGTASFQLAAQTRGNKSLTVKYLGRGDVLDASEKTVGYFVGDATTTTLAELPSRVFGAGGTATATVTEGATGKVSLEGLPGAAIDGNVTANGTATLAIPASTPAGTYSVTATYHGDETYGSSTSEARTLTVTKAPTAATTTVSNRKYGTAASVGVQVQGPAGQVPTGQVSITAAGTTRTVALNAQGRATLALPKNLAPKSYAVTVVYLGNGNLIASSSSARFTVAKGATKSPTFSPKGTIKAKKKGRATVRVNTSAGLAKATGKVRVVLTKGKSTKRINATVKSGRATVKLPKLAKGTWRVKVTYRGDTNYAASKTVSKKLTVKK